MVFRPFWIAVLALLVFPGTAISGSENWLAYKAGGDRSGVASQDPVKLPFKVLWTFTPEGQTNGFVDFGPVAANDIVYTSNGLNEVLALDAKTGSVVWRKKVISNVFSVTLTPDSKYLLVTTAITTKPTSTMFALDAKTGEQVWENVQNGQPAMGGMEGAPAIHENTVYAAYLQYEGHGGVAAFELSTGKLLWEWQIPRISPYSSVTYGDDRLYIGFENKKVYCLNAKSGSVLWTTEQLEDLPYSASVFLKDRVYVGAGKALYSFDARTGQQIWKMPLENTFGHSSPALHNGTLYFGTRESKLYAVKADTGTLVWMQDLASGAIDSSPVILPGEKLLYVGSQQNYVFAVDIRSGKVKEKVRLSESPSGVWKNSAALYQKRLYIGSLDKTFYALE